MTKTAAQLYADLEAAQDDHGPVARRYRDAERLFRKSRSQTRGAEFAAAKAAMDASIERCDDLREQINQAEDREAAAEIAAAEAAEAASAPTFAF